MIVKVCGLTTAEDVSMALELGADMTGFIFHPKSVRYISPRQAADFPRGRALRVGVFVDQEVGLIKQIMHRAKLDLVQLHGQYGRKDCQTLGPDKIIKVFWPEKYCSKNDFSRDLERFHHLCSYFLLDAGLRGGGHGRIIKSGWIRHMDFSRKWILAGGLGPGNLNKILQIFHPPGVDLNSGVESRPGRKSGQLLLRTGLFTGSSISNSNPKPTSYIVE